MVDDTLRATVDAWLAEDPDPETRDELRGLIAEGRWDALAERFSGRLAFGTAGLRAPLGGGPQRMNRLVVRQAAAGLVRHLGAELGRPPRLVVGFDARHGSAAFATDTARVAAAAGSTVHLFERHGPTPCIAV
jgi:phosphomannomutase